MAQLLLQGSDSTGGVQENTGLWLTDGTAGGTSEITGISGANTGPGSLFPTDIVPFDGGAVFVGSDTAQLRGLWVTDLTAAGTHELTGIVGANTNGGVNPTFITVLNNIILFDGNDDTRAGLWVSDGTAAGTHELTGIVGANTGTGQNAFQPLQLFVFNNEVLFQGTDTTGAHGLWVTDGTVGGTHELTGIVGASTVGAGFDPGNFALFNNEVAFGAADSDPQAGLWLTDGTAAGTHEVTGINGAHAGGVDAENLFAFNNMLLFEGADTQFNLGLWVSDGTGAGTHELTGITNAATGGMQPQDFIAFNGKVYFMGLNSSQGFTLWDTDGTAGGTHEITGISGAATGVNNGILSFLPHGPFFTILNGELTFAGLDSNNKIGLWESDGTAAGTHEVTGISGAFTGFNGFNPQYLALLPTPGPVLTGQMVLNSATEDTALPNTTPVATFTDSNGSDTAGSFTATIDWGDGHTTTGSVVGGAGSFTVEGGHTYADEGSDPASVTLTRTSDQATATASGAVTVGEDDVLAGQGTTIAIKTNQSFTGMVAAFTDTDTANVASDFTAKIDWGDGATTSGTVTGGSGTFTVDGTHTYTSPGTDTVKVTLSDDAPGTAKATATTTATVRTFSGAMALTNATEDTALPNTTPVAVFADSDTADTASQFTATINWGDSVTTTGTVVGSNGMFTVEGGHTYADEGSDTASVTLTHNPDGTQVTTSGPVAVTEDDVLTGQGLHIKPKAGVVFSGDVATFTDTDTANVAGDFTATIDWGDGTTTTGTVSGGSGSFTVDGSHIYAHPGREDVLVTLADDAPGTASAIADTKATVSSPGNSDGKADLLWQNPQQPALNLSSPYTGLISSPPGQTSIHQLVSGSG